MAHRSRAVRPRATVGPSNLEGAAGGGSPAVYRPGGVPVGACEEWARRAARLVLLPPPQTPAEGAGNFNDLRRFDLRAEPAHES